MSRTLCALALVLLAVAAAIVATARWAEKPLPSLEAQLARSRAVAGDAGLQLAPRFSPDGRYIAFALAEGDDARIVVQATDGSSRRFIGEAEGVRISPVFFPDGRRLAYWGGGDGDCGIFERDLDSNVERRLVDCTMLPRVRFDVSPDGRHVAFTASSSAETRAGLWLLTLDGSAPRLIAMPPDNAADDLHPRFSRDGREIAFFRGPDGLRQPWTVPVDGSRAPRPVGRECGRCYGLAWLPDRPELLVAGDWYGRPGLRVVAAADGATRVVHAGEARFPDASTTGDIVYEAARGQARESASPPRIAEAANVSAATGAARIELAIARR